MSLPPTSPDDARTSAGGAGAPVCVAHHPAGHPYVDAIQPSGVRRVRSDVFDVDAIAGEGVDVVHVHFGIEHVTLDHLRRWSLDLRARGIALVHTVHDIDNPHLVDQTPHHARTGELVRAASMVTTLTPSAAGAVDSRWGRRPLVIPHPELHLSALAGLRPTTRRERSRRAVIWCGTVRPNLDRTMVETWLADPCRTTPVRVVIRDEGARRWSPEVLRSVATAPEDLVDVVHRPNDDELIDMIRNATALVLPYRWGTHSGLVQLARSLDVPAVVPRVGCHADQGAWCPRSLRRSGDFDAAVRRAVRGVGIRPAAADTNEAIRAAHHRLYVQATRCVAR